MLPPKRGEHMPHQPTSKFLSLLELSGTLTPDEREAVLALPFVVRTFMSQQFLAREGDMPSQCCIVIDGLVYRSLVLDDGSRQIFSFHIAGDMPDLQSLSLPNMDHDLTTSGPTTIAFVPHQALRQLALLFPRVQMAMWRDGMVEAAGYRSWLANIGRRSAHGRLAHLFCEMIVRNRQRGIGKDDDIPFRITQEMLADALGLSLVHLNRILQALRNDGLISLRLGRLTVHNWAALQIAGDFNGRYLHVPA